MGEPSGEFCIAAKEESEAVEQTGQCFSQKIPRSRVGKCIKSPGASQASHVPVTSRDWKQLLVEITCESNLAGRGRNHDRINLTENDVDAARHTRHDRTRSYGHKSGHQCILNQ